MDLGNQILEILDDANDEMTAQEILAELPQDAIPQRRKPVMTVSSHLTHHRNSGRVERRQSGDRKFSWWKITRKGRKEIHARQVAS